MTLVSKTVLSGSWYSISPKPFFSQAIEKLKLGSKTYGFEKSKVTSVLSVLEEMFNFESPPIEFLLVAFSPGFFCNFPQIRFFETTKSQLPTFGNVKSHFSDDLEMLAKNCPNPKGSVPLISGDVLFYNSKVSAPKNPKMVLSPRPPKVPYTFYYVHKILFSCITRALKMK